MLKFSFMGEIKVGKTKIIIIRKNKVTFKTFKTRILQRFLHDTYDETYLETYEEMYQQKLEIGSETYSICLLDTGGHEDFESLREDWIKFSTALVIVIDTTKDYLSSIKSILKMAKNIHINDFPILIMRNKRISEEDDNKEDYIKNIFPEFTFKYTGNF
jgi:GTPase SAR1 family protein